MDNLDVNDAALSDSIQADNAHGKQIEIDVMQPDGGSIHVAIPINAANANTPKKEGDALGKLIQAVNHNNMHREDGDGETKGPFSEGGGGPFGSPADEPKPGDDTGYDKTTVTVHNPKGVKAKVADDYMEKPQSVIAANANEAEAEIKGRVTDEPGRKLA